MQKAAKQQVEKSIKKHKSKGARQGQITQRYNNTNKENTNNDITSKGNTNKNNTIRTAWLALFVVTI